MLNLADVLQHPDDGLHHGALARQQLVLDLHHPALHAPFNPGDQSGPPRQEPIGKDLRDVPLVAGRPAEELPGEGLEGQRGPVVGVGRGEHGPDDFPAALTARCSLSPYAQPMVSRSCAARPRMVRCYRARSSCDALPIFLLIALLLLVRESLRPSVGDFGVAASENEEFPSFTCSAGVRCCGVARARGIAPLEGIWRPERCGFTRSYGHCGMACREV